MTPNQEYDHAIDWEYISLEDMVGNAGYPYDPEFGFMKDAMVWTSDLPVFDERGDR